MKAWQRTIREQRAASDADADLFGRWWESLDMSIERAVVKSIPFTTAEKIIVDYEWMGRMPATSNYYFGIFFEGHIGGAVVYSPEYSENLGTWDRYGYTGKIILLSRGACVHWAHPHSASKLIRVSMRMLPPRYEVVTATVDEKAGEVGTIYQACGFDYAGSMRGDNSITGTMWTVEVDGKLLSPRSVKCMLGNQRRATVLARWPQAKFIAYANKGRYFAFRGEHQQENRAAISHLTQPYPKRRQPLENEGPTFQVGDEGAVMRPGGST